MMPEVIPENERPEPKRKNRAILIAVILGIGLLGVAAMVAMAGVFVSARHMGHAEYGERVVDMPEMPEMPEMAAMPEMPEMPDMPAVSVRTPAVGVRFNHHTGFFAKSIRSAFAALIILAGIYLITRQRNQRVETVPPVPVSGPEADRPRE